MKLEVSVSSRKWEPQPQGQTVEEPKPVANSTADTADEPMWIMDKLRAEHEPVKHAPISDPKQPETNNNDVKQVTIIRPPLSYAKNARFIYLCVQCFPVTVKTGLQIAHLCS